MLAQHAALVTTALAAVLASSCIVPVQLKGSVTLAWSVGGAVAPSTCADRNASVVHIVLRDDFGVVIAADDVPCETFRSRYFLERGWYDASLTLLDPRRSPVSETQRTNAFYINPRGDTFVEVAFAAANPPL